MVQRSRRFKTLAMALSLLTVLASAPFSVSETVAGSPLGTLVTTGNVTVGNATAPTGTTIFTGDKVTSLQPTLINFNSGSRIEMTKSAATFSRQGKTIVVQTDQGLLRFNFKKGEDVQIKAGKFQFTGGSDSERVGELGVNQSGQLVMTMTKGSFKSLNTETGESLDVTPAASMSVAAPGQSAPAGAGVGKGTSTAAIVAGVAAAGVGMYFGIKAATDDKSPSD
jgi:hypothetical protein